MNIQQKFLVLLVTWLSFLKTIQPYAIDQETNTEPDDNKYSENEYGSETQKNLVSQYSASVTYTVPEFTTVAPYPAGTCQLQQDVLSDLEAIWNYTAHLNDEGLKTSLISVIQFTRARIQSEPEESLDRLKYLLGKLRTRLYEVQEAQDISKMAHKRRNFQFSDAESEVDLLAKNILAQFQNGLHSFNSSTLDKQLPQIQAISDVAQIMDKTHPVAEPVAPPESESSDFQSTTPSSGFVSSEVNSVSTNDSLELSQLKPSCSVISFPFNTDASSNGKEGNTTNLEQQSNTCNETRDQTNQTTLTTSSSNEIDSFAEIFSALITNPLETNITIPKPFPVYVDDLLSKIVETHEEDILQLPFGVNELSIAPSVETKHASNVTTNYTDAENNLNYDLLFNYDLATDGGDEFLTETDPILLNFLHELTAPSEVDPVFAAASIINGTRDGLIRFVRGFTRLKKYVKIVIVFIISIAMIGGGLLLHQLISPLLFAGLLSALIPVLLLLLLDNGVIPGRQFNKWKKHVESRKCGNSLVVTTPHSLATISDAIYKYC